MKLGVLASGGLGLKLLQHLHKTGGVIFAFTDRKSQEIVQWCEVEGIPCFLGNPRKGAAAAFLLQHPCDVLVSVNYLFLIEKDLIEHPSICAFNIHGSLLPRYRGRTPHVWAIINNEKYTGVTAHLIEEGCDTGPVLAQLSVQIGPEDTGADLLEKFHKEYPVLIDQVLSDIKEGRLNPQPQQEEHATYFGKRTPEDGLIDWNWSKERIINWVRAQAPPYPGAFTWVGDRKIKIAKAAESPLGFDFSHPNGLVLQVDPVVVKTPNGALRLELMENADNDIRTNQVFNSEK